MTDQPLVSVVLPCYQVERTVAGTLDSLLGQTYDRLEIIAIDDGSTDDTARILARYAAGDPRVRVLTNASNQGIIVSLNRGVSEVRGDFIARMDADSIAAPRRLERQLDAFARRPEIGVVGTEVELIDPRGRHTVKPRPVRCVEPGGARFMGLFANPLAHVTIMARSTVLKTHPYGGTPESVHTEDYELFTRLLEAGVAFLNLREPLVTVVDRPEGTSWTHENVQVANFVASARRHLSRSLEIEAPAGAHKVLVNRLDASITAHDLDAGLRLLDLIEGIYLEREPDAADEISRIADMQRLDVLVQAARRGSMPVRVAAGGLALRYHRSVTSPFGMRHLASKRPRAALARRA